MVGRSEQAVRMVPLAACTDSHSPCCRLLLCVLTARKAQLPLGVRADRLIIVSHVVAVRRCSLARGLRVPATLDDVMIHLGGTRAVSDAEVVVIKRNATGKCVQSRFICELARCRRRSVGMERQAGSGAAGCCLAVRGCGWQAAVTVVLLVHKLLLLVNLPRLPPPPHS